MRISVWALLAWGGVKCCLVGWGEGLGQERVISVKKQVQFPCPCLITRGQVTIPPRVLQIHTSQTLLCSRHCSSFLLKLSLNFITVCFSSFCTLFSSSLSPEMKAFFFSFSRAFISGHPGLVVGKALYVLGCYGSFHTEVYVFCVHC